MAKRIEVPRSSPIQRVATGGLIDCEALSGSSAATQRSRAEATLDQRRPNPLDMGVAGLGAVMPRFDPPAPTPPVHFQSAAGRVEDPESTIAGNRDIQNAEHSSVVLETFAFSGLPHRDQIVSGESFDAWQGHTAKCYVPPLVPFREHKKRQCLRRVPRMNPVEALRSSAFPPRAVSSRAGPARLSSP